MNALTWVEMFWSYNQRLLIIEPFFFKNTNKIININFTRIQMCTWCCWKIIVKLDLMKIIS
jgi:hypothetical protein